MRGSALRSAAACPGKGRRRRWHHRPGSQCKRRRGVPSIPPGGSRTRMGTGGQARRCPPGNRGGRACLCHVQTARVWTHAGRPGHASHIQTGCREARPGGAADHQVCGPAGRQPDRCCNLKSLIVEPAFCDCGEVAERLCVGLQNPSKGVRLPSSPLTNMSRATTPVRCGGRHPPSGKCASEGKGSLVSHRLVRHITITAENRRVFRGCGALSRAWCPALLLKSDRCATVPRRAGSPVSQRHFFAQIFSLGYGRFNACRHTVLHAPPPRPPGRPVL